MADTVNAKILDSQGAAVSDSNSLPVHGTVAVSNLPGTQPVSGTVTANVGAGTRPVSVADGSDATQGATTDASSANTMVGLLKAIKAAITGTLTTSVSNFPGTQPVSGTVAVSNLPATQPVSSTDGSQATIGTTTDASSAATLVGLLKAIKAALTGTLTTNATIQGTPTVVANVGTGTQPVSGTVTANAGSGTLATSVADGSNAALGTTTDASSANTVIGLLKAIKAAITGTLATSRTWTLGSGTDSVNVGNFPATQPVSGTVTANVGTGTQPASVADGSDVAQGTTTDTSSANTVIGLLKNIKAALAGTLTTSVSNFPATQPVSGTVTANAGTGTFGVSSKSQTSLAATLCTNVTGTTPSTGQSTDGYNGAQMIELIAVGTVAAQAVSLQIEGSYDNVNFYILGTYQIDANSSLSRSAANFTLTPGNGTLRHVYQVLDLFPFLRVNPTANSLGTGLTAKLYAVAV